MGILNYTIWCVLVLLLLLLGHVHATDVGLNCDEFDHHMFTDINEAYCTVTGFTVTHSQNVVINSYMPASIRFMKFYDSTLLYVPFHLFETFTNMKTLDISYTGILELTRNTFSAANNLTYLNLSNNNITNIATSVFIGANSLMRLDLSANKIAELNENAFCGLRSLNKLQLAFNELTDIHKDIFKDNEYLESISLEGNKITYIEPEVFSRMRRIKEVNLSSNRLKRMHPDTFMEAASLENLLLVQNELPEFRLNNKSIVHQLQLDSNHLTYLTVNGTRLVRANYNNISTLYIHQALQLETLELRWNRVHDISNITNLTSLLHLDLSHNPIAPLNVTTFARLKRLRNLYLRATGINQLQFGMFSKQSYLEILDLSFNNLSTLNLDIFVPYLEGLRKFYVDGNNLSELQGNRAFSTAFPKLNQLGISRNRFNCSYLHHLLIPPYLTENVMLHIEPDFSIEETPHIRDVSCISTHTGGHLSPGNGSAVIEQEQQVALNTLKQQLEILHVHERTLEAHLLHMRLFFFGLCTLTVGIMCALLIYKSLKRKRSGRYSAGSIVFHSDSTVNAHMVS